MGCHGNFEITIDKSCKAHVDYLGKAFYSIQLNPEHTLNQHEEFIIKAIRERLVEMTAEISL